MAKQRRTERRLPIRISKEPEFAAELDAVICVNRLMQRYIQTQTTIDGSRVHHVRCGVDSASSSHRFELGSGMTLTFGFAGKLVAWPKRVLDLLKFVDRARTLGMQLRLRIAGEGDQMAALMTGISERGFSGQVELLGKLSKEQLYNEFYPSLDALLIFSELETGPIVAWEAMMHGVLVVSSEYRGARMEGILRDGENAILFPVGNPEVGAERLYLRRTELAKLAEQGRELAEQALTLRQMVDATDRILVETAPRESRRNGGQRRIRDFSERFQHGWRRMLKRPIYHGSPHSEWPWFAAGGVSEAEAAGFAKALARFEIEAS